MRLKGSEEYRPEKLAFRISEAAFVLSISESKLKRLLRARILGHIKDEGVTLITKRQLEDYLRSKELEHGWTC